MRINFIKLYKLLFYECRFFNLFLDFLKCCSIISSNKLIIKVIYTVYKLFPVFKVSFFDSFKVRFSRDFPDFIKKFILTIFKIKFILKQAVSYFLYFEFEITVRKSIHRILILGAQFQKKKHHLIFQLLP